jgi:hypothetical protein
MDMSRKIKRAKPRYQNQGVAQIHIPTAAGNKYVVRRFRPGLWAVYPKNGFHRLTEPSRPLKAIKAQCGLWNSMGRI